MRPSEPLSSLNLSYDQARPLCRTILFPLPSGNVDAWEPKSGTPLWRPPPHQVGFNVEATEPMDLTREDSGSERSVRLGEAIRLTLPENATTGYRWYVD